MLLVPTRKARIWPETPNSCCYSHTGIEWAFQRKHPSTKYATMPLFPSASFPHTDFRSASRPSRPHHRLSHPTMYCTRSTHRGSSDLYDYSVQRGRNLLINIRNSGKLWLEQRNDSTMMAQDLGRIDQKGHSALIDEMNELPSFKTLFNTIAKGFSNEDEIGNLATDVGGLFLSSTLPLPKSDIR